ncbi:AraC family transcriptional regulator [Rhodococcus sp. OK302]|uniref:AraC family transcriptional regulator n=1 Tax=Rhodococcus sp. OK302 TaxID=1882769 RepID=UPI000B9439F4|nr:AraC family transcriptional regulator [Rhodococcus sp. OK302]OYD60734.1 AraC family transcriptional regulator [Rhodococcus sp. OK302]
MERTKLSSERSSERTHQPHCRYASTGYLNLCLAIGLDPAGLMREVGLDPAGLLNQDNWVPAISVDRLLEASALASGRTDIGLQLAQRRTLSNLGPLIVVLREETDIRSATNLLIRYSHTYNESLRFGVKYEGGLAQFYFGFDFGTDYEASPQSTELVLAGLCDVFRLFLGHDWIPVVCSFPHPAPADLTTHLALFGPHLKFDEPVAGISLYAAEVDIAIRESDPAILAYAQQMLSAVAEPRSDVVVNRVTRLIESLLPAGRCSTTQVAHHLGIDRRTLHRHLAVEGTTFSALLDRTRLVLVERALLSRRYSVTDIATMVGFATPTSLTRWFHTKHGLSPTGWLHVADNRPAESRSQK